MTMQGCGRPLAGAWVGVLFLACGSSGGRAEVKVTEPVAETLTFSTEGEDGLGLPYTAREGGGALQLPYRSNQASTQFGATPELLISVHGRRLPGGDFEPRIWGVGPFFGEYRFTAAETDSRVPQLLWIDSWHYQGGDHPFRFSGRTSPTDQPVVGAAAVLTSTFEHSSDCSNSFGSGNFLMCGAKMRVDTARFEASLGSLGGLAVCSPEVIRPFVGTGTGANAVFENPRSVEIEGGSMKFSCSANSAQFVACGAETTVAADGCNWKAFAAAAPYYDVVAAKHTLYVWVGATTDPACAETNWCNSEWFATEVE